MAIAEITTALTALKTAMDLGKGIAAAGNALEAATLKLQLADLMGALAEARVSMVGIMEQVEVREREIARLNEALKHKAEVVKVESAFYEKDDQGRPDGDPYCMHCWEANRELAHLALPGRGETHARCPRCKTQFHAFTCRKMLAGQRIGG